jgi:predicted nucleic acid-binding protein
LFADQRYHAECARTLLEAGTPLLLSPFVLAETDYLITKYSGVEAELAFLDDVGRGAYTVPPFENDDIENAKRLVEKYRDLNIGLADASIAILAVRYDCRDVLTLDIRHFRALRAGRKTFRILPADA